jgi:hypothetical protein
MRESEALNQRYCRRKGYERVVVTERTGQLPTVAAPQWEKAAVISNQLARLEVTAVLWIDDDAFVNHQNKRLETVIAKAVAKDVHIFVGNEAGRGKTELNTGVLIVRNTAWSREFIDQVLNPPNGSFCHHRQRHPYKGDQFEQTCIRRLVADNFMGAATRVASIACNKFNCSPYRPSSFEGVCDPFVMHVFSKFLCVDGCKDCNLN